MDEKKLPRWAQDRLNALRRDVAGLEAALDVYKKDTGQTRVVTGRSMDVAGEMYLPEEPVRFLMDVPDRVECGQMNYIEVYFRHSSRAPYRELCVTCGTGGLAVRPGASNALTLGIVEVA